MVQGIFPKWPCLLWGLVIHAIKKVTNYNLVGAFNPVEKYQSKRQSSSMSFQKSQRFSMVLLDIFCFEQGLTFIRSKPTQWVTDLLSSQMFKLELVLMAEIPNQPPGIYKTLWIMGEATKPNWCRISSINNSVWACLGKLL